MRQYRDTPVKAERVHEMELDPYSSAPCEISALCREVILLREQLKQYPLAQQKQRMLDLLSRMKQR